MNKNNKDTLISKIQPFIIPALLIIIIIIIDPIPYIKNFLSKNNINFLLEGSLLDKKLKTPLFFTFLVVFQGLFGANGISQVPSAIPNLLKNGDPLNTAFLRLLFISSIAYTATQDIVTSIFGAFMSLIILYFIRTSEERKQIPGNFLW